MTKTEQLEHIITFKFRGYRCAWKCSCGKGSKSSTTDTFLGAHRKSQSHLVNVGGDLKQPHKTA